MAEVFKSVTHGTCALGGRHTSEEYVDECPALGKNAEERLQSFQPTSGPRAVEVACARCGQPRWPHLPLGPDDPAPIDYVCHRCRVAVAGGYAVDPCPAAASPAQQAARTAAVERLRRVALAKIPAGDQTHTTIAGSSDACPADRTSPVNLDRVSITPHPDPAAWKRARGGRPRKHPSDVVARREAQRAHRARQRAVDSAALNPEPKEES